MNMKLSLLAAALVLVPAAAFADDDAQPVVVRQYAPQPAPQPTPQPTTEGGYQVPHAVPYEGGAIPEGASLQKRPNLTLIGVGLGIFSAAYVPSLITAAVACGPGKDCSNTQGSAWLYLPVVGPFITIAQATSVGGQALAAFDAGMQLTGAALAVAGLVAQKKFVVWQDKSATVTVTPTASTSSAGIALTVTHL